MQSNGAGKSLPTGLERYPDDPNTYVFPSSNRILSHESSPQLAYQKKTTADKSPSINYCPNIKMLINDVSFLTHRAKDGDTVIYVGSTIGNYLPTLAKMFPCVQFLVYDGNPKSCHYRQSAQNPMEASPPNIHVKPTWFSDSEARNLISMVHPAKYDSAKTLLMVDTRNVTRLPLEVSDKDDHATVSSRTVVTDEDVQMDMRDQRDWVEILRPRAASLKFRMQISSSSRGNEDGKGAAAAASLQRLEYLDGTLSLQPFAHRASTEVRLFVDAKESRDDRSTKYSYPTRAYDSCVHDACMFHHNFVTRRQHLQSPARIKVRPVSSLSVCLFFFISQPEPQRYALYSIGEAKKIFFSIGPNPSPHYHTTPRDGSGS
jgi:hypothetical protein